MASGPGHLPSKKVMVSEPERIAHPVVASIGGVALTQLLGGITGVVLARGLGPEGRGLLASMILWPTFAISIGDLGLGNSLAYYAASSVSATSLLRLGRLAAVLQSSYLVPFGLVLSYIMLGRGASSHVEASFLLVLAFIPAGLISRYVAAVLQGRLLLVRFYAIRNAMALVSALVLISLVAGPGITVSGAVMAYIAGLGVMVGVSIAFMRSMTLTGTAGRDASVRDLLSFGVRSLPGSLHPVESLLLDQVIITLVLGYEDLGLYISAVAITNLPRLVGFAVGTVAMPTVAQASDSQRRAVAKRILVWSVLGTGIIATASIVFMPILMNVLFGRAFHSSIPTARILAVGSFAFGLKRIAGDILRGMERPGLISAVEAVSWPLTIVAMIMGSSGGLAGVAAGLAGMNVLTLIVSCGLLARATGRRDSQHHSRVAHGRGESA